MPSSPGKAPIVDPNPDYGKPKKKNKRRPSWSDALSNSRVDPNEALRHVLLKMRNHSISNSGSTSPPSESEPDSESSSSSLLPDYTSLLSDELLLRVLNKIGDSKQNVSNSLVCRRWCVICGKFIQSVKLLDWEFLESGRLTFRFPYLININIATACIKFEGNSGILLSNESLEVYLSSGVLENDGSLVGKEDILDSQWVDRGVRILAEGCKNLSKIVLMNVSEDGLSYLGEQCELLQEMELHYCSDSALRGISGLRNLQILKLVGSVTGIYESVISDIGLTILAQGCKRLVTLELVGCEGSYDGIKAIGQCCQMLEEMTIGNHRMEGGWLSALSYCGNLKILRIHSCKNIDTDPGPDEHLRACPMLEELHLRRCQMRNKQAVRALFLVCCTVRELVIKDCWGLDNSTFTTATIFRAIRSFSLEGCSLLSTEGLEMVVLSWQELDKLRVISCNNVKDSEITGELATLFSVLKEFKWRPDAKSLLSANLAGTGIGQKGGRSLKK